MNQLRKSPIARIGLIMSVVVSTALIGIGCNGSSPSSSPPDTAVKVPTKINVATSKNMWCALPLVAKAKGFFKDEGLDANYNFQTAGRYCMDALVSGSADLGTVVEVNVSYLGFTGTDNVRIVGTCVSSDGSAIVYRRDKGISKPQDLRGHSLALSPGTTSDIYANWFLRKYGLTAADVRIQKLQPVAIPAAIASGAVDAASAWQPFVANAEKALGGNAGEFREPDVYTGYMNVGANSSFALQHPAAITAFLRALRKAEDFIRDHKADAQAIIASEAAMSIDVVRSTWQNYDFRLSLDTKKMLQSNTEQGDFIRKSDPSFKGKGLPAYAKYYDESFYSQVPTPKGS